MEMDLNFTDYIHFGSARIEADASFPTEAKKVIYFGGAKPYHVYRSTKTNPN